MSDQWTLEELRQEAARYGLTVDPDMDATELDRTIQAKVADDFRRGICSACGRPVHSEGC